MKYPEPLPLRRRYRSRVPSCCWPRKPEPVLELDMDDLEVPAYLDIRGGY